MPYEIGSRVRTTSAVTGPLAEATGEVDEYFAWNDTYNVMLDNDPVRLPTHFGAHELEPEQEQ